MCGVAIRTDIIYYLTKNTKIKAYVYTLVEEVESANWKGKRKFYIRLLKCVVVWKIFWPENRNVHLTSYIFFLSRNEEEKNRIYLLYFVIETMMRNFTLFQFSIELYAVTPTIFLFVFFTGNIFFSETIFFIIFIDTGRQKIRLMRRNQYLKTCLTFICRCCIVKW